MYLFIYLYTSHLRHITPGGKWKSKLNFPPFLDVELTHTCSIYCGITSMRKTEHTNLQKERHKFMRGWKWCKSQLVCFDFLLVSEFIPLAHQSLRNLANDVVMFSCFLKCCLDGFCCGTFPSYFCPPMSYLFIYMQTIGCIHPNNIKRTLWRTQRKSLASTVCLM